MQWRSLAWAGLGLAALFTISACGRGNFSDRASAQKENALRYPLAASPTTIDPGKVQDGDTIDMLQQVYEGLVGWNEKNEVVPVLAEKWEVSEDARTYTFTIKKGVKFHSGRELTAEDIKWSFERSCNPALGSPVAATYLSDIVGVKERLAGKAEEVAGIKVLDPNTLIITIDKSRPYFLGKLTYMAGYALDKDKIKDPTKEITKIEEAVGTGPFMISSILPDQLATLTAFADYHGGAPKISKIERPVVKDAATRLNMYRNGEIDMLQLERQDLKGVQEDTKIKDQVNFFPRPSMWYIGINTNMYEPFKKRDVRRAIAMAIDKKTIVEEVLGGVNEVANGIVPPGVLGRQENPQPIAFNVEEAKRLLAAEGFPGGKGFPEVQIYFREARPDIRIVAETVASQLKQNLGITVKLQTMEWRAYLERHNNKQMPFFHMRWGADYLDPENFLSTLLASYGPENKVFYNNKAYDALTSKADSIMDLAERTKLYGEAENMVLQDAVFIPIYFQKDIMLISKKVKGLREGLFGQLPHTTVTVEP